MSLRDSSYRIVWFWVFLKSRCQDIGRSIGWDNDKDPLASGHTHLSRKYDFPIGGGPRMKAEILPMSSMSNTFLVFNATLGSVRDTCRPLSFDSFGNPSYVGIMVAGENAEAEELAGALFILRKKGKALLRAHCIVSFVVRVRFW